MNFESSDLFPSRHIGPDSTERNEMLRVVGASSLDALVDEAIPASIRLDRPLDLPAPEREHDFLERLRTIAAKNQVFRSFIGLGYHDCVTPSVILRNVLENPGWYTPYTPYQAEVAQGRLEALLNFQTMVSDLTGMEVANASLLDEATAAAEAMTMILRVRTRQSANGAGVFFVSDACFPQTLEVVRGRAEPLGIEVRVGPIADCPHDDSLIGALVQSPDVNGALHDLRPFIEKVHNVGALVAVATDLLSLAIVLPPGEMGADVVVGNSQRFGVPLGYGGPHAAFFATRLAFVRQMPGRIIGVSVDAHGNPAYRMALQTREQHIRREKATSNICTAQALLANMAGFYAVYHGADGLRTIARRVHALAVELARQLVAAGYRQVNPMFFDTITVDLKDIAHRDRIRQASLDARINLRFHDSARVTIALDETATSAEVDAIGDVFRAAGSSRGKLDDRRTSGSPRSHLGGLERTSQFLTHPVFHSHRSETEMMRYIRLLERRDIGLDTSMIPLGSCTMKLNAASEMLPITWPEFSRIHPFAPAEQTAGYRQVFEELEASLALITGSSAVSLQPNSGAQGELAGLLTIRAYHHDRGDNHRNVVLIPASAHGTNPASAVMAGMTVVVVSTDQGGNVDLADLRAKATRHAHELAALMITYPSTHGVFEDGIQDICAIVHEHGGQVYMDGANMNAQVGLTSPHAIGADVCHLNLHKTFAIPHGGGGPGMGPIAVATHLVPYLPRHPLMAVGGARGIRAISAAPWGSASILLISYAYVRMLGGTGMTDATRYAILNANYVKSRLEPHYPVLYTRPNGRVGHEMIFDLRAFKQSVGIDEQDVAKRLMDYGFHAPTVSFPVPGTLMIEPTESEPKEELDRFCDAMIAIRGEIQAVVEGLSDRLDNPLKNAPHTAEAVSSDRWEHAYSRELAAYPLPAVRKRKFWPSVGRIDNPYGDRNLICSCPPVAAYAEK